MKKNMYLKKYYNFVLYTLYWYTASLYEGYSFLNKVLCRRFLNVEMFYLDPYTRFKLVRLRWQDLAVSFIKGSEKTAPWRFSMDGED